MIIPVVCLPKVSSNPSHPTAHLTLLCLEHRRLMVVLSLHVQHTHKRARVKSPQRSISVRESPPEDDHGYHFLLCNSCTQRDLILSNGVWLDSTGTGGKGGWIPSQQHQKTNSDFKSNEMTIIVEECVTDKRKQSNS